MRFKKGTRVEVLVMEELPCREWRCGEIVSGNGHTYNVRYENSTSTSVAAVEKVPRKVIRPCAPLGTNADEWKMSELVEVYHLGSWKLALIINVVDADYYIVTLLSSREQFRVHKSNVRTRHLWKDDQWILMGKGYEKCEAGKVGGNSSPKHQFMATKKKYRAHIDRLTLQVNASLQESPSFTSRALKRASPYCSATIEESSRKMRAIESGVQCLQYSSVSQLPLEDKVDAVAYPHENMGETCMHISFINNQNNGFDNVVRGYSDDVLSDFSERCLEPNNSSSHASSVASSCVVVDGQHKFSSHLLVGSCLDADDCSSSAYSLQVGDEEERCNFFPEEDVTAQVHKLELHAYRSTLGAMFVSGPLSWKQEALLTNLRISLHITNDEHLVELRNLISAGTYVV